jgi:hypothetical protein
MKRLLTIIVLCLASRCFATALVQSNAGGSATGSVASLATLTSSAGGFGSTTLAGDLLVLVIWSKSIGSTSLISNPISGGYSPSSWTSFGSSAGNDDDSPTYGADCFIYYLPNAAPMTAAQTTTITVRNNNLATGTISIEFSVYEFSGIAASPVLDVIASDFNDSGTPATTWASTTHTNLIICVFAAQPGSNLTAGAGYTLGVNASVATIGQTQYQLNAAPGQTGAGFSGTDNFWAFAAVSFNATSGAVTGVPRHRGQVF